MVSMLQKGLMDSNHYLFIDKYYCLLLFCQKSRPANRLFSLCMFKQDERVSSGAISDMLFHIQTIHGIEVGRTD